MTGVDTTQEGDRLSPIEPSDIAIVTLPPERWEEYRDLRLAALRAEPIAFSEPYERAAGRTPEEWRRRLADPANWVVFAERGDTLVGLAAAYVIPDEPAAVHVVSVYVDASVRQRGVGRLILSALIERIATSSDAVTLRLGVLDTNAAAIALYASLGFAVVGEQRDIVHHTGRAYDELIMERPVSAIP